MILKQKKKNSIPEPYYIGENHIIFYIINKLSLQPAKFFKNNQHTDILQTTHVDCQRRLNEDICLNYSPELLIFFL